MTIGYVSANEPMELPAEIVARLGAITDPLKERLGRSFDYYESPENDRTR